MPSPGPFMGNAGIQREGSATTDLFRPAGEASHCKHKPREHSPPSSSSSTSSPATLGLPSSASSLPGPRRSNCCSIGCGNGTPPGCCCCCCSRLSSPAMQQAMAAQRRHRGYSMGARGRPSSSSDSRDCTLQPRDADGRLSRPICLDPTSPSRRCQSHCRPSSPSSHTIVFAFGPAGTTSI